MKTLIIACLATAAMLSFSACETDADHRHEAAVHSSTTTTTEETTTRQPVGGTTETRTTRSY